jgi:RNA polymerase sigma-70 factor (ECF subfamily)
MQDNRIIELLQKRNEQALSEIRCKYGGICFRIAEQMLGNAEDAEECVNEMLLAVWNSVPPHEPRSLEAYLVTLLRRAATDQLRHLSRKKRGGTQLTQTLDELSEVIPAQETVESEVDRHELTAALRSFLDELPEKHRQIFLERYYFSKPVQMIADAHEMRVSTVNVLLHRIRKKLKKHLEKEGFF